MMEYTPLSELRIGQRGGRIRCRVLRIWESTIPTLQDQLISLDSLLVDEQGTSIQTSIRKEDIPRMRELTVEGKIYILANFAVVGPKKTFRASPNDKMLRLATWTIINEAPQTDLQIPYNSFNFVDEATMDGRIDNDVLLTDAIGCLKKMDNLRKSYTNGRLVGRKTITIQTILLTNIPITLWGTKAEEFNEDGTLIISESDPLIIAFTGMTVQTFKADTTLSTTSASKIYINLDIPEVHELRNRFSNIHGINSLIDTNTWAQDALKPQETEQKTILQLLGLDPITDKGRKFTCKATIMGIDATTGWWYSACRRCKAGIGNNNDKLSCRNCTETQKIPIPWYKVDTKVIDGTEEAKFLIFGKHFEKIIKMPASLLCEMPESNKYEPPQILKQLNGTKYEFTVSINDRFDNPEVLDFKVSKITPIQDPSEGNARLAEISEEVTSIADASKGSSSYVIDQRSNLIKTDAPDDIIACEEPNKRKTMLQLEGKSKKPATADSQP